MNIYKSETTKRKHGNISTPNLRTYMNPVAVKVNNTRRVRKKQN